MEASYNLGYETAKKDYEYGPPIFNNYSWFIRRKMTLLPVPTSYDDFCRGYTQFIREQTTYLAYKDDTGEVYVFHDIATDTFGYDIIFTPQNRTAYSAGQTTGFNTTYFAELEGRKILALGAS